MPSPSTTIFRKHFILLDQHAFIFLSWTFDGRFFSLWWISFMLDILALKFIIVYLYKCSSFSKYFWRYSLKIKILVKILVELVANSQIARIKVTHFLILSPTYFLMAINKVESFFSLELDSRVSSKISSGLIENIGSTNKGLSNRTSSNYFILLFNTKFLFCSSIEYFQGIPCGQMKF
jgi:hypothetical protein